MQRRFDRLALIRRTLRGSSLVPALGAAMLLAGCATPRPGDTAPRNALLDHDRNETQVNAFTGSTQERATIAVDAAGRLVCVWDSRRQQGGQYGVYARWLDQAGTPLTGEVQVNDYATTAQMAPSVACGNDGSTWIVWTSHDQDGDLGSIVTRRYAGVDAVPSAEIGVNALRDGHQSAPVVAVTGNGDALVAWTNQANGTTSIRARRITAGGVPVGRELIIDEAPDVRCDVPTIAALPGNRFVIAWARTNAKNEPAFIVARVVDPGDVLGGPLVVSDDPYGGPVEPSVAVDGLGRPIVAWMERDGDGYAVRVRGLDARGRPVGRVRTVAPFDGRWQSGVAIAAGPRMRTLVCWNREDGTERGADVNLVGVVLDEQGVARSAPIDVTVRTEGPQHVQAAVGSHRAVWTRDDVLAVAWSGEAGQGDHESVAVTVCTPPGMVVSTVAPGAQGGVAVPEDAVRATAESDAPVPPVFDPNWKPLPPVADLLTGTGPDGGFQGVSYTGWNPPDPEIAAGPAHLVMVANGAISFFTHAGVNSFQVPIGGGGGFWQSVGATSFVFDPEVLFDPHSGRFVAMANERSDGGGSYYLLAVSDDADPNGTWHKYRLDASHIDNNIDSPNLAVDDEVVYLTADFFGPDQYHILMVEKAPLLSGGAANTTELVLGGSGNQSLGLPMTFDADAPAQYMLQSSEGTGNGLAFDEVRFHALLDPLGSPSRVAVDVDVPVYAYPAHPPQQGTSVRPFLFEPRFWSCVQRNGSVWAVHHVNATRSRVRWYEFDMNGWPGGPAPTVRQWGELTYGPSVSTFFPAIAVDAQNNAVITFARSATNEYISMARVFRRHDDPLGTFRPMEYVRESSAPSTSGRWGDYAGAEPDPALSGRFWVGHEWTDSASAWRTWIAPVVVVTPCPGDATSDGVVDVVDLLDVLAAWGALGDVPQDVTGDGVVSIADVLLVLAAWGPCPDDA